MVRTVQAALYKKNFLRIGYGMIQQPIIVAQLVHIQGPLKGEIQEFAQSEITVGRHPSSAVRFPADLVLVSRTHARIARDGNTFKLIDSSTNGTFVNGKRIKEALLKTGDVIGLGKGGPKFSFLTEMREGEAVPEPPRPPEMQKPPVPHAAEEVPPVRRQVPPPQIVSENREVPLVVQYGPTLRSFKMVPVIIGRDPKCDVVLELSALRDRHAEIFFVEEQYWVKDLTGSGMVQINGTPAQSGSPVKVNDELVLAPGGPAFRFLGQGRFVELEKPVADEPPPIREQEEVEPGKKKDQPHADKGRTSLFKRYFKH
jgi:pSer/pThr/pTyr-binding forkhead associated (FHA) protein